MYFGNHEAPTLGGDHADDEGGFAECRPASTGEEIPFKETRFDRGGVSQLVATGVSDGVRILRIVRQAWVRSIQGKDNITAVRIKEILGI